MAWLFAAKRRRISLLQPYRWLLEVFLAVAEFVGFRARWPASIWMIVLNTLLPLVGPPCPSRLLPKFLAQKEHELWSFQSIPLLINSISLKRDGVRICLGKDVGRWSIEGSLTREAIVLIAKPVTLSNVNSGHTTELRPVAGGATVL